MLVTVDRVEELATAPAGRVTHLNYLLFHRPPPRGTNLSGHSILCSVFLELLENHGNGIACYATE